MFLRNTISFFKIKEAAALSFLFSSSSLMIAVWAAALPYILEKLELSDSELGLLLLLGPVGALSGVFLSTRVFAKIPVGVWLGRGNIIYALLMLGEVISPYKWVFGSLLYLRGMMGFLNGVAMNAVVGKLEDKYERRLMATCHAMYSIGGGVGAGVAAVLFSLGIVSPIQAALMAAGVIITILVLRPFYVRHDYLIHSKSRLALPGGPVLGLAFICLVLFMTEGSIVDWSSIYLSRNLALPLVFISLGYGGFAVAMTLGRMNGDMLIPRIGQKRIVILGTFIAALGLSLVSISTTAAVAIAGFVLTGIGCSCVVPVLFSSAGRIPGVSPVQGFGMVTSGGLIGFLAGPSVIGFISEHSNLTLGFRFVVVMLFLAGFVAWRNKAL